MSIPQIKRKDTRPSLRITCSDDGVPVDLTTAQEVRVVGVLDEAIKMNRAVSGSATGDVVVEWLPTETNTAGRMQVEVQVTWADGGVQTFPGHRYLEVEIIPDLA